MVRFRILSDPIDFPHRPAGIAGRGEGRVAASPDTSCLALTSMRVCDQCSCNQRFDGRDLSCGSNRRWGDGGAPIRTMKCGRKIRIDRIVNRIVGIAISPPASTTLTQWIKRAMAAVAVCRHLQPILFCGRRRHQLGAGGVPPRIF